MDRGADCSPIVLEGLPDMATITLLQLNDLHGYLTPHPELVWGAAGPEFPKLGGLARIKTLFDRTRADNPGGVVALDNGDTFHGTHLAVSTKGQALVAPVNALGLTAMTAHWEFAWGPDHVHQLAAQLDHPLLAANCYSKADGSRPFPPSLELTVAGIAVGIIGIAATIIDKTMPDHFSEGVRFTDGVEEAREQSARLRKNGAELIIVLSHLGLPQDIELARQVPEINVILSGHTHNRLAEPEQVGDTVVIQSGCHGAFIGRLDIDIEHGRIVQSRHALIPIDDSIPEDDQMAGLVNEALAKGTDLSEVIGHTPRHLHRNTCLDAPMDDVLLAAVARTGGTDIAFSNGWRYGVPIPSGDVTLEDLWDIVPMNPVVSTVTMTGREILAMMEESIERTFACDPFGQMGGYLKRFRGMTFHVKLENPASRRIVGAFVGSDPLKSGQSYAVSFITSQGVSKKYGTARKALEIHAIDALKTWFENPEWDDVQIVPGSGRVLIV